VLRELEQHQLLYSWDDISEAAAVRTSIPVDAVTLTSDTHQHPVWSLAGQVVPRGYSYWLWSYGLPIQALDRDVPRIYAGGDETADLLKQYKISYVYIGPSERAMYAANEAWFAARYERVFESKTGSIYRVGE